MDDDIKADFPIGMLKEILIYSGFSNLDLKFNSL